MRSTKAAPGATRRASKSGSASDGAGGGGAAAQALTAQALEKVTEVSQQLQAQGESFLATQKSKAAEGIRTVGESIRQSAASLQEGPLSEVGEYVEAAADGLDRASQYLVEQDWRTLRQDAEQVVRQRPAWFLGSMFLVGFAAARFLKATEQPAEERQTRRRDTTSQPRRGESAQRAKKQGGRAEQRNGTTRRG